MDESFIKVGLTGGSGSGKTLVAKVFSKRGIPVIDADKLARQVVEPGHPCLGELVEFFGEEILNKNGTLKRSTLADIAFSDTKKLEVLNSITHKHIGAASKTLVQKYKSEGRLGVVYDAPLLIESGADKECSFVVAVLADKDLRVDRIMARDSISKEDALRRINVQQTDDYYIKHSDFAIRNDGDESSLIALSNRIIDKIFCKGGISE